jgi:imidazolonepropionase-like amidohydrolase
VKVILGGRLIDGKGGQPVENSAIMIEGKMIKAAGSRRTIRVPSDAEVIDADGRIVMPGLIEGHNHPLGERDLGDPGFKKYYDSLVTSPAREEEDAHLHVTDVVGSSILPSLPLLPRLSRTLMCCFSP